MIEEALRIVAQLTSLDDLDRVFRAVVARQEELFTDEQLQQAWLDRINKEVK